MRSRVRLILLFVACLGLVAACGGGGSSSSPAPAPVQASSVKGTAATGAAIAGATITIVDSTGKQASATTDSSGNYSLNTTGMTPPFLVKVVTTTASSNGYPAGTTFYSVSSQASPTIVNVTPLTDLILHLWYGAQSTPVTLTQAFANPGANPPPSAATVQVIQTLVLDIVQPVLQQNGVNLTGLDLIGGTLTIGAGVDSALDKIQPIAYSSGTNAQLTINTTSSITQNTTISLTGSSAQVATTNSNGGTTISSTVTSTVVPTSSAQQTALAGVQATFTNLASVINAKGTALSSADVSPLIDPAYLNSGQNAAQFSAEIVRSFGSGATINSITVQSVAQFDATNGLIGIVGTVNATMSGSTVTLSLPDHPGENGGFVFKQGTTGSWLFYGNQQQFKTHAGVESVNTTGPGGIHWTGQVLQLQLQAPTTSTSTPCTSSYATSATAYSAQTINTTTGSTPSTPVTISPAGYALTEDPTVFQTGSGGSQCQFDEYLNANLLLSPSSLPALVGDTVDFGVNGGAAIAALRQTIPGYTTETVSFTNLSSNALSAVTLGGSNTFSWTLPTTFAIAEVDFYGSVSVANGSSYVNCEFKPSGIPSPSTTSVSITVPSTCNGSNVVSLPSSNAPSAVQINVSVQGTHGEVANAWWGFN